MESKEAPIPLINKPEISETFDIEIKPNQKYKFTLSHNGNYIKFLIINSNSFIKQEYELIQNLKDLHILNIFFLNFENLEKIVKELISLKKENNLKIIKDKENDIFIIKILNKIRGEEFIIKIPQKKIDISEISNIIPIINQLQEKILKLEQENDMLKKNQENLEKRVSFLELFDSNIINKEQKKIIIEWIPKKIKSTELIFDTKIHGDTIDDFKNKCKGKNPTIVIIKTDEGVIFGGYTEHPWEKEGPYEDYKAFIFSFKPERKYKIYDPNNAICGYSYEDNLLLQFGCIQFSIKNECTQNSDNFFKNFDKNKINPIYEQGNENIIDGENFQVERLEIFKINY